MIASPQPLEHAGVQLQRLFLASAVRTAGETAAMPWCGELVASRHDGG
jgi:hypothetical protein